MTLSIKLFIIALLGFTTSFGFAQTYPSASCNSNKDYFIKDVKFEGINNTGTDKSSYTDYTGDDAALVTRGDTYTLSVKIKKRDHKYLTVWIDWNHDGDFTDSGENYVMATDVNGEKTYTISITVPAGASVGETRMRVIVLKGSAPTSSGSQGNKGEVEDYAISIGDMADFLYYISDSDDDRYMVDRNSGLSRYFTSNGVSDIEAMAIWPIQGYSYYYVVNGGTLGTLGLTSGTFSSIGDIDNGGSISGSDGSVTLDDVDGLAFDARTGELWASQRRDGDYDVLFKIDPATGYYIQDAFGSGVDYVMIDGSGVYEDFDDFAISPYSGSIYGVSNDGSSDQLLEINTSTGAVTVATTITGASDIEGLSFSNDNILYGTSGNDDKLYTINTSTGAATEVGDLWGGDVEAIAALVEEANKITGNLWKDTDQDGVKDAGETTGISGVTIELWDDVNNNNEVDAGDELLQRTTTDASGDYSFDIATTGEYVMQVYTSSLPSGYALTTDNKESADFSTNGNTDSGNNFGAESGSDCDGDGIPDFAEGNGDSDGDGVNDKCDPDSDNDGIIDSDEGTGDTDGDGIKDYLDLDSDNDGIPDAIEANGGIAPTDYNSSTGRIEGSDSDGDGLMNAIDAGTTSNLVNYDSDGDGYKDYVDLDSDNDGILDLVEAGGADSDGDGTVDSFSDSNSDGYHDVYASSALPIYNNDSATEAVNLPNYRDMDSDGDSIDDTKEGTSPAGYRTPSIIADDDGDGILNEWDINSGGSSIDPYDYDSDGVPDYQDQDSDNDSGSDIIEGNDLDANGVADSSPSGVDANKNGVDDAFDNSCIGTGYSRAASALNEQEYSSGDSYIGSSDIEICYDDLRQEIGIRYTNLNIEQGATISSAYMQFTAKDNTSGAVTVTIYGEDTDNAAVFVDGGSVFDITGRTKTTASVSWSPADWTDGDVGADQKTGDLKSIIQEIVNRTSWTSGNSISIIISGSASDYRRAEKDPTLTIDFDGGLMYSCGSDIALQDDNSNSKQDFRDISKVLPVALISFTAQMKEEYVQIDWKTATEFNNDYFVVQKSQDGIYFEDIDNIAGAGNSNVLISYQSLDYYPYEGITYYRLKQVDYDGTTDYSNIAAVRNNPDDIIQVFPNPSNGNFTVETKEAMEIVIYSATGQEITRLNYEANTINKVDLTNYSKGIYFLAYIVSGKRIIKKLVVR